MSKIEYKYKNLSPFKLMVLSSFPFIEADFDALTNWELMCLLKEKINELIANNNTMAQNIEALNDWFNNLDVQDEIDNKLDEMAESGELTEIIAQYLQLAGLLCYNTVANMKEASNIVDGSFVKTFGKLTYNDGLGEFYKIRTITSGDVVDEVNIIALTNYPTLIAELIKNQSIIDLQNKLSKIENDWLDPLNYGAKGDGTTDDYQIIQNCINNGNVRLSSGSYYVSQPINIPSNKVFDGGNCEIIPASGNYALTLIGNGITNPVVEIQIQNVRINTTQNGGNGINVKDGYFIYIDNVNIFRLSANDSIGFNIENGFNHVISNSRVYGNRDYTGQIGLNIYTSDGDIANMTNCKYDTLLLQNLEYGVKTNYGVTANTIVFDNMGFSNNDYSFYIDGYTLPLTITNTRMESILTSGYGFYIGANAEVMIDSLNAYNIPNVIKTISNRTLVLRGAFALTGTTQSTKYLFTSSDSTGMILNYATFVSLSTTYSDGYINMKNIKISSDSTAVTANNLNLKAYENAVYELTSVSLLNIYGKKNSEGYIWTKLSGLVIYGSANSTTNKWTGSITLEPYKMYHVVAVDSNQIMIFN